MKRAISPEEFQKIVKKKKVIPDFIFEIFNELITERCSEKSITIYLKDVVAKVNDVTQKEWPGKDWPRWWLDVEDEYRESGWKVTYDRPAYCESYEAYFLFELE
tara:strand:- start:59 stop:370 length:312 start_codon:yes stop_codon:yes gene_type:complete